MVIRLIHVLAFVFVYIPFIFIYGMAVLFTFPLWGVAYYVLLGKDPTLILDMSREWVIRKAVSVF